MEYTYKDFLNNKLITHYNYNSIKFDDSEYVNLLIDYKEFKTKKVRVKSYFIQIIQILVSLKRGKKW